MGLHFFDLSQLVQIFPHFYWSRHKGHVLGGQVLGGQILGDASSLISEDMENPLLARDSSSIFFEDLENLLLAILNPRGGFGSMQIPKNETPHFLGISGLVYHSSV